MSGSVPGGSQSAEPNLTPILDMVFQLITFFMLVINFKAAELDLSLQLPVIGSAKPLPGDTTNMKLLVLNVNICTKCPHAGCDAMATLRPNVDEDKKVKGYSLVCEHGHETPEPRDFAINNGRTCLSVYGRLLCKENRGKDLPSIEEYLRSEADMSLLGEKFTREEMIREGKELPDVVVIRADSGCRFGAVNYVVTKCQEQGYRTFALKTGMVAK
jgi:biopolymer transport protein ExbD